MLAIRLAFPDVKSYKRINSASPIAAAGKPFPFGGSDSEVHVCFCCECATLPGWFPDLDRKHVARAGGLGFRAGPPQPGVA